MHWLHHLSLLALALVCTGGSVGFGMGGVLLARRAGWTLKLPEREPGAALYACAGVVYAVALGLMVAGVQGDYGEVEGAVRTEASAAADLHASLDALGEPARSRLRSDVERYVRLVVEEEWPALRHGGRSRRAEAAAEALAHEVAAWTPVTSRERAIAASLEENVRELMDARNTRLLRGAQGIGALPWAVVLAGAAITLGFASLFPMRRLRAHLLASVAASAMLGLLLFLLVAMGRPLQGPLAVEPEPLREVLARF